MTVTDQPDPPPPGGPVPPGPPIEPEPQHRTGGLSVEEWIEENRRRATSDGRADLYRTPHVGRVAKPQADQRMAGWALGLSLAFCIPFAFLVGAGLAIAVLVKGRDGRDHGMGKAIAALVIAGLLVVANVAYAVVVFFNGFDDTERDADGRVVEGGEVTLDRLQVGDCFSEPNLDSIPTDEAGEEASVTVDVVPCDEPHQAETYHQIQLDGGDYPGSDAIDARAAECVTAFRAYVGVPYRRSRLDFVYYFPTSASWRLGDREIVCSLVNRDLSDLTGSKRRSRD